MTQDEIIEMVEQDGLCKPREFIDAFHKLERFAALVASAEREACAEMVDSYVGFDSELSEAIRARGEA